jgi:hypothetical protein
MDLLFSKYANPYLFINEYIKTGRFCFFIDSLVNKKIEDDRYEFYLHKVYDKTYNQFTEECLNDREDQTLSENDMLTTIQYSGDILGNFNPEEGGEN